MGVNDSFLTHKTIPHFIKGGLRDVATIFHVKKVRAFHTFNVICYDRIDRFWDRYCAMDSILGIFDDGVFTSNATALFTEISFLSREISNLVRENASPRLRPHPNSI